MLECSKMWISTLGFFQIVENPFLELLCVCRTCMCVLCYIYIYVCNQVDKCVYVFVGSNVQVS